jgi:hypothetical protein
MLLHLPIAILATLSPIAVSAAAVPLALLLRKVKLGGQVHLRH